MFGLGWVAAKKAAINFMQGMRGVFVRGNLFTDLVFITLLALQFMIAYFHASLVNSPHGGHSGIQSF